MNPAQYTSVGVTAAILAPTIMWVLTWPLHAPNAEQAGGIAALLIAAFGGIHALIQAYLTGRKTAATVRVAKAPLGATDVA